MDIKEKFGIKNIEQEFFNPATGFFLSLEDSAEKQLKSMTTILKEIIADPKVFREIKYVNEKDINKIFYFLRPLKEESQYSLKIKLPVDIDWLFYIDTEPYMNAPADIYLSIAFGAGERYKKIYKHFWFKCLCTKKTAEIFVIEPLVKFLLRIFLDFEDGGRVFMIIGDNYKIEEKEIIKKSPQVKYFIENFKREDVEDLLI